MCQSVMNLIRQLTYLYSQNTLQQQASHVTTAADKSDAEDIIISATGIHIPSHMRLSPQEYGILAQFQGRMYKA